VPGADRDHKILPDGYCETCRTVPCQAERQSNERPTIAQLDRIEATQHKIMRALGIPVDGDQEEQT
jgi:hypothetical protein